MKQRITFQFVGLQFRLLAILLVLHVGFAALPLNAQYSLEDAIGDAIKNSSISNFNALHNQIKEKKIENISKNYFPKISFSGQATYQSEVTELPIELPGIEIDPITKDQYKVQGEISQNIYDGGLTQQLKSVVNIASQLDEVNTEIEIEKLRESVINQYFKILELQSQITIINLKKDNLVNNLSVVESGIANGVMQSSDKYELQASIIQINQELQKLETYLASSINTLKIITKSDIPTNNSFALPVGLEEKMQFKDISLLKKLDVQKELVLQSQEFEEKKSLPKAMAFVNIGYGKPALNFLRNSFEPYGIGGVRVVWNLDNMYTKKNERQIVQLNRQLIDEQKEVIQSNLDIRRDLLVNEIVLLETLEAQDAELLELRIKLRANAESKLKNGVITSNHFLPFVNQESEVRAKKELRKLQIIKNQYLLEQLTGNYNK